MRLLNENHYKIEELKYDYYSGSITEEEYRQAFPEMLQIDERYIGFSKLYSQYVFVRESEDRSFLYTGGWETLLTRQTPNYFLLLVLLILITPIFCDEYSCNMNEILITQKGSAKKQVATKMAVAFVLTFLLVALVQFMELGYSSFMYGLPNGIFSIQSLRSFGDSPMQVTLWQAFWFQFALKELGFLFAAVIILFLSVFLKKGSLTIMSGIAILHLPFLAISNHDFFLRVPGPWAMIIGSIYLNEHQSAIDSKTLQIVFAFSLSVMVLLSLAIRRENTNWHCKKQMKFLTLCLFCLLLSGCTRNAECVCYNYALSDCYETTDYLISGDFSQNTILNKQTGVEVPFPLSGVSNVNASCNPQFFGIGNEVYYLRSSFVHPNAGYENILLETDYVKLDLSSWKETILYHWGKETNWFFGLLTKPKPQVDPFTIEPLFLYGHDLYYRKSGMLEIMRMSLYTGVTEKVLISSSIDIAYDGSNIIYLDNYNRLCVFNLDTGGEQTFDSVIASRFFLYDGLIYFMNLRDNGNFYIWYPETDTLVEATTIPDLIQVQIYYQREDQNG